MKGKLFLSSFQARFSTEIQEDYMNSEVIEIDRVKYCIEQGKYDFEFNKSKKEYIPLHGSIQPQSEQKKKASEYNIILFLSIIHPFICLIKTL